MTKKLIAYLAVGWFAYHFVIFLLLNRKMIRTLGNNDFADWVFTLAISSMGYVVIAGAVLAVVAYLSGNRYGRHGSGAFATNRQLFPYNIFRNPEAKAGHYITWGYAYPDACNGVLIAGAGAGKGTNFIIPNLLGAGKYEGSWCVIDPKGQNAYVTSDYQRKSGRKVIILNPWNIYPEKLKSDTLNPLDFLDPESPDFMDDCRMIAAMIIPKSQSREQYWERRARALLVMFLSYMIKEGRGSKIQDLQEVISPESGVIDEVLELASGSDDVEIRRSARKFIAAKGGIDENSKEFNSVVSTLYDSMEMLASRRIYDATGTTSFDLNDLSEGKYTIYLVIPSERLQSGSQWLRLITMVIMRSIVRNRGAKYPFTFMLDEFASLGYMKEIETAVQQYRGYNIFSWAILQDLSQLKSLYPKTWQTFMNCALVQIYFGINSLDTAQYVSKISGTTNIPSNSPQGNETARPLITVEEVINESYSRILCKIKGLPIAWFSLLPYFDHKEWVKWFRDWPSRYNKDIPQELK